MDEEEISDVALLTQTGYLTIKDVRYGDYYVGYPNAEVAATLGGYLQREVVGRSVVERNRGRKCRGGAC